MPCSLVDDHRAEFGFGNDLAATFASPRYHHIIFRRAEPLHVIFDCVAGPHRAGGICTCRWSGRTRRSPGACVAAMQSTPAVCAMPSIISTPGKTGLPGKCPWKCGSLMVTFLMPMPLIDRHSSRSRDRPSETDNGAAASSAPARCRRLQASRRTPAPQPSRRFRSGRRASRLLLYLYTLASRSPRQLVLRTRATADAAWPACRPSAPRPARRRCTPLAAAICAPSPIVTLSATPTLAPSTTKSPSVGRAANARIEPR